MKRCPMCLQEKEATREYFGFNKRKKDGLQGYCLMCSRQKDKSHYNDSADRKIKIRQSNKARRKRNLQYVWDYLKTHPCIDCGEANPIVLEFDHVRGKKFAQVCKLIKERTSSIKAIQAEISKCEIRCANCHRLKTAKELGWYSTIVC